MLVDFINFNLPACAETFVAPRAQPAVEADTARVAAAIAAGLSPLALEQPANAYDSVVAMLQSYLDPKQDEAHEPECRHVCWETQI